MIAVATAPPHSTAHRTVHAAKHVHTSVSHVPPAAGSSPGFSLIPIAIVVIAVLIANTVINGRRRIATAALLSADLTRLQTQRLSPVAHPGFITEPGETCYWAQAATQWSIHTRTQRVGGYGGPSIRIARGMYVHAGAFASTPITTLIAAQDDTGIVYVTDRRIVFIGRRASHEIAIKKIIGAEPFQDGMQIDVANKKALTIKTGDSRFAYVALRIIHNLVGAITESAPSESVSSPSPASPASTVASQSLPAAMPSIVDVWPRIIAHQGETFRQKQGGEFTYHVDGNYIRFDRTTWSLPRTDIERALALYPIPTTTAVNHLQAPSYVYAILMDPRIIPHEGL